jgi:uncharacterized protein (TIGR02466 family)
MHGIQITPDVILTYGTPLLQRRIEAMLPHNAALAELALRLRAAVPGASKSNAGGWHSAGNIFEREEPGIALLTQHVRAALLHMSMLVKQITAPRVEFDATLYGWINVNGPGDYNTPHCHPGGTWSGVYYIRTGPEVPDRPNSGRIQFMDPRTRCDLGATPCIAHTRLVGITPADGMLLIFPSYLEHYVHPYFGTGERITLAFNSLVQRLTPLP